MNVEYTDQFEEWFGSLDEAQQERVAFIVGLLEERGPALGRPYVDTVRGSGHANMKEMRPTTSGSALRAFFAFDPQRTAILLIGGDKQGDKRFYDQMIRIADDLYEDYLEEIASL